MYEALGQQGKAKELKASARALSGKERTGGASPPRLMEQESQMDPLRHEEWLGLRSRLEHAVAEGALPVFHKWAGGTESYRAVSSTSLVEDSSIT